MNTNVVNFEVNKLISEFEATKSEYSKKFGSEINRIAQHKDKIKSWLDKPELKEVKKKRFGINTFWFRA